MTTGASNAGAGDPRPPRLAERLAHRLTRSEPWSETATGDLHEEFRAVLTRRGRTLAGMWYWSQIARLTFGLWLARTRSFLSTMSTLVFPADWSPNSVWAELRLAARAVRHQRLTSFAIVLTMALGLGVNAAAFSMLNVLVLTPFPFPNIDRLAIVGQLTPTRREPRDSASLGNFQDLRSRTQRFETLAALTYWSVNITGGEEPQRSRGYRVTGDFFKVFNAQPTLGRFINETDEDPSRGHLVVLSHAIWVRSFGARLDIVGQPVRINGEAYEVIGVGPRGFDFPDRTEVWAPVSMTAKAIAARNEMSYTITGRLRAGASREQAAAEMSALSRDLVRQFPKENADTSMTVLSFTDGMADTGTPELIKMINVAALVVLLIASANVANLLLARGNDRRREIAVRLALGGGRVRIVRLLLIESVVLGLVAVPISLGFASIVLRALKNAMPARILVYVPGWERLGLDPAVIVFTIAGALVAAILFGLLPALQTSRPEVVSALREGGRSVAGGRSRQIVRRVLVVAEFALALPLLVSAGLAATGAYRFVNGPQGYEPAGVTLMQTSLSGPAYTEPRARRQFAERLLEATRAIPGVRSAATINLAPTTNDNSTRELEVDGRPADPKHRPNASYRISSPGFFDTLRVPIASGRSFTDRDREGALPVAIVSRSLADRLWPGQDPIGRRLKVLDDDQDLEWRTVVGVSQDLIDDWFDRRFTPMLYVPMLQRPSLTVTLLAKTDGDPAALGPALRRALTSADPDQPVILLLSMTQSLHERTIGLQIISSLMGGLGCLALALSVIGIYSLLAYDVSQRAHEIGVRMALGATRRDVARLTVGHALRLAAVGLTIGVLLTLPTQRLVVNLLFNVVTFSPLLLAALACTLALTALAASVLPARRASRMDPSSALRIG